MIVLFGLVGLAVSSSDQLFPAQYPTINSTALIRKMAGQGVLDDLGLTADEVKAFMQSSDVARISYGRAIYPRYLDKQNDPLSLELYNDLPEGSPNLVFRLLRQAGVANFSIPVNSVPERFPDNSDVLVLGCKQVKYIEVKAIAILESDGSVYIPIPPGELTCPDTQ